MNITNNFFDKTVDILIGYGTYKISSQVHKWLKLPLPDFFNHII